MAVFKRGNGRTYYYSFMRNGKTYRASTRQTNKRVAEDIESTVQAMLAKGQVGVFERTPSPTLRAFAQESFLPDVRTHHKEKPRTVVFYTHSTKNLLAYAKLADALLDTITSETIAGFVAKRQADGLQVSSINRELATLRKMFGKAKEWGKLEKAPPKVRLLPGENRRERTLSPDEESWYLLAAEAVGRDIIASYAAALAGIRAVLRAQHPQKPKDPFLLRDVMTILLDCGVRPDECYRLKWEDVKEGLIEIRTGKSANARRQIPASKRVAAILNTRQEAGLSDEWVFPAETQSGHIEPSSVRGQHARACEIAGVKPFVMYCARHTALTRWSKTMDPYTLAKVAGHASFATTRRYVHPSVERVREAMERDSAERVLAVTGEVLTSGK